MSLLSFCFRSVDREEDLESPAKLLPLNKELNGSFQLKGRYFIIKKLSVGGGYEFQLLRIAAWENILEAGDFFSIGLTYRF